MPMLTSKERNAYPEGFFGLPKDRKYPLIDEAHVRKAIQYFKFCSPSQRNELSKNINARAKELGMTLKISKDSAFYKYANKNIVKESGYDDFEYQRLVEIGQDEITQFTNFIQGELQLSMRRFIDKLFIGPSLRHFLTVEKEIQDKLLDANTFKKIFETTGVDHLINPITHINSAMKKAYDLLFGFIQYNYPGADYSTHFLIQSVLEDLFFYLMDIIYKCQCNDNCCSHVKIFEKKLQVLDNIVCQYACNNFYVVRKLRELQIQIMIELRSNGSNDSLYQINELISPELNILVARCGDEFEPDVQNRTKIFDTLTQVSNMNTINSVNYLQVLKNELKSQVDIILLERDIIVRDEVYYQARFLTDLVDRNHREIISIIGMLEGSLRKENITFYNRDYSLCLCSADIVAFTELDLFERLYVSKDINGDDVYYGLNKDALYLLGKTKTLGELVLIRLYDGDYTRLYVNNLLCSPDGFNKADTLSAIRINFSPITELQSVTEGIVFDEDGSFKFSFKPKKTYMDEYSENHKVLVQNFKTKNILGMKTNLAFLFELINSIERKQHSQKSFKPDVKRDMEKARMFAINDFKTYLKEINKVEPGFDFTTYYQNSDYGKVVIGVNRKDIIGMKRLFQTIILS